MFLCVFLIFPAFQRMHGIVLLPLFQLIAHDAMTACIIHPLLKNENATFI